VTRTNAKIGRMPTGDLKGIEYAGFGRRLLAFCIDCPVWVGTGLAVVALPARSLILREAAIHASTDPAHLYYVMSPGDRIEVDLLWAINAIVAPWLYYALQEASRYRATLGKRLLGVQVSDLGLNRISFARASGRFFAKLIPTFGVGYCLVWFTTRKQALHDILAKCLVVRSSGSS
jgi:uncharacterized RDD family membrane protein YckC